MTLKDKRITDAKFTVVRGAREREAPLPLEREGLPEKIGAAIAALLVLAVVRLLIWPSAMAFSQHLADQLFP